MLATAQPGPPLAPAVSVQAKPTPVLSLSETKVALAGSVSETRTFAAAFGPALVTKISKMLLEPAPTREFGVVADWLTWRSA
jgi:hypothetical protein